jgi:hypothetical protein
MKMSFNGFKKYGRKFEFMIGDTITFNGHYMACSPSSLNKKAKNNLPKGDVWSRTSATEVPFELKAQIVKHLKKEPDADIFTNLELTRFDKGEKFNFYEWTVVSIDLSDPIFKEEKKPEIEHLFSLTCTYEEIYVKTLEVEKITEKQIVLKDSFQWKTTIPKSILNIVKKDERFIDNALNPRYACLCDLDHYDQMKDLMVTLMEKALTSTMKRAESNLEKMKQLKTKEGY